LAVIKTALSLNDQRGHKATRAHPLYKMNDKFKNIKEILKDEKN
jgi:hypothetical protein